MTKKKSPSANYQFHHVSSYDGEISSSSCFDMLIFVIFCCSFCWFSMWFGWLAGGLFWHCCRYYCWMLLVGLLVVITVYLCTGSLAYIHRYHIIFIILSSIILLIKMLISLHYVAFLMSLITNIEFSGHYSENLMWLSIFWNEVIFGVAFWLVFFRLIGNLFTVGGSTFSK